MKNNLNLNDNSNAKLIDKYAVKSETLGGNIPSFFQIKILRWIYNEELYIFERSYKIACFIIIYWNYFSNNINNWKYDGVFQ